MHAYSSEDLLGIGRVQFGRYVSKTDWLKCVFSHPQELLCTLSLLYLNFWYLREIYFKTKHLKCRFSHPQDFNPPKYSFPFVFELLYLCFVFERHISQNRAFEVWIFNPQEFSPSMYSFPFVCNASICDQTPKLCNFIQTRLKINFPANKGV